MHESIFVRFTRSLSRPAVAAAVAASVVVHAGLVVVLVNYRLSESARTARLTDAGTETVLAIAPRVEPSRATEPVRAPEPPVPVKIPDPPAPKPDVYSEPIKAPERVKVEIKPQPIPPPIEAAPPPSPPPVAPAAPGPRVVSFAGVESARASKVVYVIDASGAMVTSLDFVKAELARSVARLDSSQTFQVVIARQDDAAMFSGDGLLGATAENKSTLADFLAGLKLSGRSDPLAGLTAALKLKPDLVYLLTHSIRRSGPQATWGAGREATLEALNRLNPVNGRTGQRPVVIKSIQFIEEDPSGLLAEIASRHGDGPGSYRVMPLKDLR